MAKEPKPNGVDHVEDEDIEITLDAPTPEEVKVAPQEDAPVITDPPPAAVPAEDGIETLRANLEREKSQRIAAQEDARKANERAQNAGKEVQDTNLALVTNAIAQVNQDSDMLEANYAQAMTDGDFTAAAKMQRKMSENAAKLQQLESGKTALEAEAAKPREEPRIADPVEALAAQLSPRSAQWVRSHPEYATDQRLYQKMLAAHNLAVADGVHTDTDDYFDAIEDALKIRRREPEPERETALSEAAEGVRRQSPASAPVSRGGGMDGQKKPGTVRLSAAEVEMAGQMGQSVEEYAREKQALISEGKLN